MPDLFAYTDGACSGNPGPGGWGALMRAMDGDKIVKERELKGGEPATTNNRMELMAAISALEALARPTEITIVTDRPALLERLDARYWQPGLVPADDRPARGMDTFRETFTRAMSD